MTDPQRYGMTLVLPDAPDHRALVVERCVRELLAHALQHPEPLDWPSLIVVVLSDDGEGHGDIVRARIDTEGYARVARDLYRERWGVELGGTP